MDRATPARSNGSSADRTDASENTLLDTVAARVRRLRDEHGWTRWELAQRSGLSVRFLARVESGEGNISILRLDALARALGTTPDALLRTAAERPRTIVLVGLRGAGKSTVGPLVAQRLSVPFVEMDTRILEACGLPRDQLFELHGERYYRQVELETLRSLLDREERAVIAAAGGVVTEPATWRLLCERTKVVWLRARPEEHWNRVIAQGDRRPMAGIPAAMEELRAILEARARIYAQAHLTVDTSRRKPEQIAESIVRGLSESDGTEA